MALSVTISGTTDIQQGAQTTLTATVRDSNNNVITAGLTYAWTASRGSFDGDTDQVSAVYDADFTDANDVDVGITCAVSLAANPNPTVSAPSLTALSELGITGIVANLLITSTGDVTPTTPDIYRMGQVGTADPNSDPDITSNLAINRIRWTVNNSRVTLNRAGSESWNVWDNTNMDASIFAVAPNGDYAEMPVDEADNVGSGFILWNIDTTEYADFITAMDAIDAGDMFLVGVGDSDSIGFAADSGSGMATVTARAAMTPPPTPSTGVSIHNTLLFRQCRNYIGQGSRVTERGSTTQVRAVSDNNYETSSSVTDYDLDISDGSNPTQVDAIVVKYTGDITSYVATPTGGSGSAVTRTVPDEVMDIRGQTVSLEVGGLKHDLFLLDSDAFTATSVRMNFTGSNIRIYEIMLLALVQEIDATTSEFQAWQPEQTDRTGRVDLNPGGRLSKENGSGREKRNVELTIRITPEKTKIESVDDFLYDLERNKRIVFCEAFSENPNFIYPAVIASLRIPIEYRRSSAKWLGYNLPLLVREQ